MDKELILKGIKYYSDNGVNFILEPNDGKILTDYINELQSRIEKANHYINCHATDFDDGRWNLELTEIELLELQEILRGGNK